ncbi:MAG TPA: hypothetical protein PKJ41_00045 [Bryobacteraceae bacterium]|nr:hypothetical protein [Bryobacteraceae bacterium]
MFLDDDIRFQAGGWDDFEAFLLRYRPAIGVPYFPWHGGATAPLPGVEAQSVSFFDAMVNAFSADLIHSDGILPYIAELDARSWHFSQYFLVSLAELYGVGPILQSNCIVVANDRHATYPQSRDFKSALRWFEHHVLDTRTCLMWRLRRWTRILLGMQTRIVAASLPTDVGHVCILRKKKARRIVRPEYARSRSCALASEL